MSRHPVYGEVAKELMAHRQIRFVVSCVKPYTHKGLAMEDLIMWGRVGLLEALDKFRPDSSNRFTTYAWSWVLKPVRKALHGAHFLSLPTYRHDQLHKLRGAIRKLPDHVNPTDAVESLSEDTGLDCTVVVELLEIHNYYPVLLDCANMVADQSDEASESIEAILDEMSREDVLFLDLLLGLYTKPGHPMSLDKVARHCKMTVPQAEMKKRVLFDTLRGSLGIY